jgi:membrane-associated PAP2 superfamily phosphatase
MPSPLRSRPATCKAFFYLATQVLAIPVLLALLAVAANRSGLDLWLARSLYDPVSRTFPGASSAALDFLGHRVFLLFPIALGLAALAGALGSYRRPALRPWRGALWAVVFTCLVGQVLTTQLKHFTALPRPYALNMFGGDSVYPTQFWAISRKAAGGALPSGHATAGYALLTLYFLGWAMHKPMLRWGGLCAGIACGLLFSAVRIAQGAHFLSQTLWSAVLMWLLASLLFYGVLARRGIALERLPAGTDGRAYIA